MARSLWHILALACTAFLLGWVAPYMGKGMALSPLQDFLILGCVGGVTFVLLAYNIYKFVKEVNMQIESGVPDERD